MTLRPKIDDLCLLVGDWLNRDIPAPDFLLGELLSTTCRALLVAPTGLGKTNLVMALGAHVAQGRDFLHWRARRPARVLYVDGEMSRRLLKVRAADACRRLGEIPKGLALLSRDDIDGMAPLDTSEGQGFVDAVIDHLKTEFVIFDSVMSLIPGDMKEEDTWQRALPWLKSLTNRSIGQMWVHHTGHDETRSYGTKTREWQLDAVMLGERLEGPTDSDIALRLSFTKARERAPHNKADFESVTIRLEGDQWTVERATPPKATPRKKASPTALKFHGALLDAQVANGQIREQSAGRVSVTMDQWKAECYRLSLVDAKAPDNRQRAIFSKYRLELVSADKVACNGELAWAI